MRLINAFLFALAAWPVAVSANQVYLVGFAKSGESKTFGAITSFVVPMESIEQCRSAGEKLMENNENKGRIQGFLDFFRVGYDCIEGN